ncbi:MAG TPA: hypothetical protein VJ978_01215 [Nitriliruptoraceae bacterium]|nr:hypothetical protein [Nitriliruptoraceae bacterium]
MRATSALAVVAVTAGMVGSQGAPTTALAADLPGSTTELLSSDEVPTGTDDLADDIRILLLRSYIPADGRMAIDADPPEITLVKRHVRSGRTKEVTLPDCPKRITSARLFTNLFNDVDSETPQQFFTEMIDEIGREIVRGPFRHDFPHCSWWARINTSVYESRDYDRDDTPVQEGMDIFLPDSNATYWAVPFVANQEPDRRNWVLERVDVQGKFQEQLFMSHVVYDSSMNFYYYRNRDGVVCQSYNTDYQIEPDPGSVNPWQVDSQDYDDTYTVSLEFEPRARNCSGGGPGQYASAGTNFNVLPLSRTDSGYGPQGPSSNLVQGDFFGPSAGLDVPRSSNACGYIGADLTPCAVPHMFVAPTQVAQSSVWSNPVAGYLASGFVADPGFVYVFRGKAPRVPEVAHPVPWADDGSADYDMRYYSLCVDVKVWPYPAQDANWSCANGSWGSGVYDADTNPDGLTKIEVGDDGYWTVIVSSADLSDSTQTDGATVLRVVPGLPVAFILRHMVAQDSFTTAVPSVERDGAWTTAYEQLQEYYPVETVICNEGQFENKGWTDGGCFVPPVDQG